MGDVVRLEGQLTLDGGLASTAEVERQLRGGRTKMGTLTTNPMLALAGPGPEGRICRDCTHFFRQGGVAGTYYKCDLRRVTSGPATDHRVKWPACARFDERG